ncbi:hypothetical protein [Shouchella shacheensis]|uniref:hypothetical protein n=1 Tax=Shouchella shacheensis TaxID=1649580 RepID=UPI00074011A5|nr:hypothetical protein [Shouchella shacheensis]
MTSPSNKSLSNGQTEKEAQADDQLLLSKKRDLTGIANVVVALIAVSMSLFHLYTAFFGVFESILQRSAHLTFALLLTFALYRPLKRKKQSTIPWYDYILLLLVIGCYSYFVFNAPEISSRMSYVQPLSMWEVAIGIIAVFLLLEATRRVVGNALAIIMVVFLAYGVWGHLFTGLLSHREFTIMWIVDHLFYTTSGVFSTPLGVSAALRSKR